MEIGISYDRFWTLNPRIIDIEIKAFKSKEQRRISEKNMIAHLQGAYMVEALTATVGNMFSKGSRYKYPDKPYEIGGTSSDEMSEEEKRAKTQAVFSQLEIMASNFRLKNIEKGAEE